MCMGVSAAEIFLRYIKNLSAECKSDISPSGRAVCCGVVAIQDDDSVDRAVELQCERQAVKSWSDSGSGIISISEPYYVTPGHDYQVVVSVDVYNSQGRIEGIPIAESRGISCPSKYLIIAGQSPEGFFWRLSFTSMRDVMCNLHGESPLKLFLSGK